MLEEGKLYEVVHGNGVMFLGKQRLNTQSGFMMNGALFMYVGHANDYEDMILLCTDGRLFSFEFDSALDLRQEELFRRVK